MESGLTEIRDDQIQRYVDEQLLRSVPEFGGSLLQRQFELVTSYEPLEFHQFDAIKPQNRWKNRPDALLPIGDHRVLISSGGGGGGSGAGATQQKQSDYINASFFHVHL